MLRNFAQPRRRHWRGYLYSFKLGRQVKWHGLAHQALFRWLDVDAHVVDFVPYYTARDGDGQIGKFAALVYTRSGAYLTDVVFTSEREGRWPGLVRRLARARQAYRLFTRDQVFSPSLEANVWRLRRAVRRPFPANLLDAMHRLPISWPAPMGAVIDHLGPDGMTKVEQLLAHGYVQADLQQPLDATSCLTLVGKEECDDARCP